MIYNKQMQDEEGFDNNQKVQLVDFNYRPLSIQHQIKRNLMVNPRGKEGWHEIDKYLPVHDELRQEYTHSLIAKQQQYVVFNNFSREVGLTENQICFQTDFQSSNLEIVIKRKYLEYELYMRPDTNTSSYFQWFYFKVRCLRAKKNVTFTIKNFVKSTMLYTQGLRPFFKTNKDLNTVYCQLSTDVKYFQCINDGFFNLKFTYQFQVDGEQVQFCSQPPYTYSKIIERITQIKAQKLTLCKSQLGKKVPYLIFNQQKQTKAIVIAIARQHPGETIGSWMMDGFLSKLQGLSESIMWIVVPMMNVDGVILGNTRTGIAGFDYNRYWSFQQIQKKQKYFPEIVTIFSILKSLRRKYPKKIKMFLDFHGHSSQQNVFSYGPPHQFTSQNFILSRIFPQLLSRKNENFSLEQSSYIIKQDKRNTARSLLYNYFGVPLTYTIQGSFGLMRGKNVGAAQFIKMGEDIALTVQDFLCNYALKEKSAEFNAIASIIKQRFKQKGDEGEQYDSDSEAPIQKRKEHQFKITHNRSEIKQRLGRSGRGKVATDISVSFHKDSQDENNTFQLFKIQQSSPQQRRYIRHEGKRNQTEIAISKENKTNFLPKLKETFTSRQRMKSTQTKEENSTATVPVPQSGPMMNIKQIQKHLFRLRNSRVGKKIIIINAYGV